MKPATLSSKIIQQLGTTTRRIIAFDIENLVGSGRFDVADAQWAVCELFRAIDVDDHDHLVVGYSSSQAAFVSREVLPSARIVGQLGRDGADCALVQVLEDLDVTGKYTEVVIVSGDGRFTKVTRRMRSAGVPCTVVAHDPSTVAWSLRDAAHRVVTLTEATTTEFVEVA